MKIGIITMPLCSNYGGTLQNWALQQVLQSMGHEPITLRFPVEYQGMSKTYYWVRVFPMQLIRYLVHKFIGGCYIMPQTIVPWKKSVFGMESFVDKHIHVTEFLPKLSMKDIRRYGVEALIVGSDQIWRPVSYDAVKYYFCGFAVNSDILRIAYAPSIALNTWPFNNKVTTRLKELIKQFSAVSVREESSVALIKENLGVEAQWMLDPTMLLEKENYIDLCKELPLANQPFVFAYILDITSEKMKMVEQTAKTLECSIRFLTAGNVRTEDTIEKWLANFRDCRYVITDSFHGTVFSLIFQKQFFCFYNSYRGNARMDSLKKISGLENNFITEPTEIPMKDIDYTEVESKIEENRIKCIKWLEESLV